MTYYPPLLVFVTAVFLFQMVAKQIEQRGLYSTFYSICLQMISDINYVHGIT